MQYCSVHSRRGFCTIVFIHAHKAMQTLPVTWLYTHTYYNHIPLFAEFSHMAWWKIDKEMVSVSQGLHRHLLASVSDGVSECSIRMAIVGTASHINAHRRRSMAPLEAGLHEWDIAGHTFHTAGYIQQQHQSNHSTTFWEGSSVVYIHRKLIKHSAFQDEAVALHRHTTKLSKTLKSVAQ